MNHHPHTSPPVPALRAATAMAYHAPGVGALLTYPSVRRDLLVAPVSVAGARVHPAELRQLFTVAGGPLVQLASFVGAPATDEPTVSLVALTPGVRELAGGLVAIETDPPSFVFATFLHPGDVAPTAGGSQTLPPETRVRQPAQDPSPEQPDVLWVRPSRDEQLGVTIVVIEPHPDTPFGIGHHLVPVAQAMAAACAVEELTGRDELL